MQAIAFEAIPEQHRIQVPDGIPLRVVLLWESPGAPETDLKRLFASVTEGVTDEDLERAGDSGGETRNGVADRHQHRVGAPGRHAGSADRAAFERFLASSPDAAPLPGDER
jgi:hypothetical protein